MDVEGLGDKGFVKTDRYFAHFNRVRVSRLLCYRNVKQYHQNELTQKGVCCAGRCASEFIFSFVENSDAMKYVVSYPNVSVTPKAI